jgi:hypothetical protein
MSMLLILICATAAATECLRLYNCNFKPTLNFMQNRFTIGKASKLAVLNASRLKYR